MSHENEVVTAWTYDIDGVTIDRERLQEVKESIKKTVSGQSKHIEGDFLTISLALHELERDEPEEVYSDILKQLERMAFGDSEEVQA